MSASATCPRCGRTRLDLHPALASHEQRRAACWRDRVPWGAEECSDASVAKAEAGAALWGAWRARRLALDEAIALLSAGDGFGTALQKLATARDQAAQHEATHTQPASLAGAAEIPDLIEASGLGDAIRCATAPREDRPTVVRVMWGGRSIHHFVRDEDSAQRCAAALVRDYGAIAVVEDGAQRVRGVVYPSEMSAGGSMARELVDPKARGRALRAAAAAYRAACTLDTGTTSNVEQAFIRGLYDGEEYSSNPVAEAVAIAVARELGLFETAPGGAS